MKSPIATIKAGQIWQMAKNRRRYFRVVTVDLDRQRATVVTSSSDGAVGTGRKPYGVTTRSFDRGRYLHVAG